MQYACNVGGTSFAFAFSGLLFSTYGVAGSAWLGAGLEATHLAGALLYYLVLQRIPKVHTHGQLGTAEGITGLLPAASVKRQEKRVAFAGQVEVMGGEGLAKDAVPHATEDVGLEHEEEDTMLLHPIRSLMLPDVDMTTLRHGKSLKRLETVTQRAALLKAAASRKQQEHAVHAVKAAAGDGGSSSGGDGSDSGEEEEEAWKAERHAPWINYVLAMTFCVQALMIGVVLSTAPLYLYGQHGFSVWQIGALMAGGCAKTRCDDIIRRCAIGGHSYVACTSPHMHAQALSPPFQAARRWALPSCSPYRRSWGRLSSIAPCLCP